GPCRGPYPRCLMLRWLTTVLSRLTRRDRRLFSRKKKLTARVPGRRRPTIEMLEDRLVPTLSFQGLVPDLSSGQIMQPIQVRSDAPTSVPVTLSLSAQTSSGTPLLGGTVTRMTDATTHVAAFTDLYVFGGGGKDLFLTAQAGADLAVSNTFLVK